MSERGEITEKLRKNVRAVLMSSPKGVLISKFCGDYNNLVKETFPWKSLGYKGAIDLLMAMPTVARLQYSEKDRGTRVFAIADSNTFLPSWWKKYEGQNIVRRTLPALPAATEHRQTERTVAVDNGGIYSLFVGFRTCYGGYLADMTRQTAQKMKRELPEVMKKVGTPVGVYVTDNKGYGFVRFRTAMEVARAIEVFHMKQIAGTWLYLTLAKTPRRKPQSIRNSCGCLDWEVTTERAEEEDGGRWRSRIKEEEEEEERRIRLEIENGVTDKEEEEVAMEPNSRSHEEVLSDDSDGSWDDSLLTSSLLPTITDQDTRNTDRDTSSTSECHSEWFSPRSRPYGNGLIPVQVSWKHRVVPSNPPPLVSPSPYPPSLVSTSPYPPPPPLCSVPRELSPQSSSSSSSSFLSNSPFYRLQQFLDSTLPEP